METSIKQEFKFPVGYEKFHKKQLFNFQLNRPYSFGYARFEDLQEVGQKIKTFADWKKEMLLLAEKAVFEERRMNAAFYYRASEFYTKSNNSEKNILYNKFIELFYKAFENDEIEKHQVPYENAFLSSIRIPPSGTKKGTIIIHGGFDSFIEEFYSMMKYFSNLGFEVIGFEGPGQGATLRKFDMPITIEWEKPTKAILDFFHVEDATLIGLSMGGWLCLRASAFENRIKRVIASGHAIDYMKSMPSFLRLIHVWCINHMPNFMNRMAEMKFENKENMASWMVDHMKFITKKSKPMDALDLYLQLNEKNIHSELVKQDVLVLTSKNDHFVPLKMHEMQMRSLVNAKSVTGRIFTKEEHAENHCQIGNFGLALETMSAWLRKQ
ncbi:MAG: alpha/beta fold hydrolase [Bacteroidales bacterium]|nr:alpha/beta fold hydrolase [Bacteroidales bacterium]